MHIAAIVKRYLPRFSAPKRTSTCWVCDTPVGSRYPEDSHGSPLGDAFTFGGCEDCSWKRAVTAEHAAWFLTLAGADDDTPPDIGMMFSIDAKGERWTRPIDQSWSRPIHVYSDGRYVPLIEWAASAEGKAVLRDFRERRGVRPGEDARTKFGIGITRPERTHATAH